MSIKKTISSYDFVDSWPMSRRDNFSRGGLFALYEYLDALSEDLGEDIEYDPIAFCCDYTEYSSAWKAMEQYQPEDMPTIDDEPDENGRGMDLEELGEAQEAAALEWLQDRTTVIEFDGGVIIQNF